MTLHRTTPTIWRDGRLCHEVPLCEPPADLDGVLTTSGCDRGRVLLWESHRQRLLRFPGLAIEERSLPSLLDLESLLAASDCLGPSRLRVSAWPDFATGAVRVEAVCSPLGASGPGQSPVWLAVVRWDDPPEAGHKVIARHRWKEAGDLAVAWGADDALLADQEGRLLETSKANVFVRRGLRVATPPAPERCLPGIMRQNMLALLPTIGLRPEERDVFWDELAFADEVWIANAVTGVVRVRRVGERVWDQWPLHRRLAKEQVPAPGWSG